MSGRWFLPRRFWAGRDGPVRWDWEGLGGRGGQAAQLVAWWGPCAPPGVRFADPSGVVVDGIAGCDASEGLRSFMLEFTLL